MRMLHLEVMTEVMDPRMRLHHNEPSIVHGDLKPMNVLVCQGWRAKLSDFGCSKFDQHTKAHTRAAGSPNYMPSESRLLHAIPAPEWDIYALGIIMYEVFFPLFVKMPDLTASRSIDCTVRC